MAYRKGSDVLLYVDVDGLGTYTQVAGLQQTRLQIRKDEVDVTNQQSTGKYRELLDGAGITKLTVSGSGVFVDTAPLSTLRNYTLNGTIRNWRVVVPGEGQYQGPFQLGQFDRQAPHAREISYDVTLESAGVISFT